MGIGELARRAGVAPSAVRYYERAGLLPARHAPTGAGSTLPMRCRASP